MQTNNALGLKAVALARQSVGVREEPLGSNWGPYVKIYLASVGLTDPEPWCAAFVNYKIQQAATQLGQKAQWPKTGYCPSIGDWARANNAFLSAPVAGCVFLVHSSAEGRYIHTGFVIAVNDDGTVSTVEGNTNDDGSANGIGIFARRRAIDSLHYVAIR